MSFLGEMRSRNVFKVALVYLVVGWGLIQVADLVAPQMNLPEWAPRMVTFVVLLGFPVALVLAWALELTHEGVKKARGSNLPIYGVAAVLAGAVVYWYAGYQPELEAVAPTSKPATATDAGPESIMLADRPSIAVLPFENMAMDRANEPFTLGIHDDLLTQLSKIRTLNVISRTSVLRYREDKPPLPEIARELGVTAVLEGGVQRIGDQVRINVQLIDAASDEHLWAETYDRELSAANIFAIQSEIARAIAAALQATLSDDDHQRLSAAPTHDMEALDAYFTGKQLADIRSLENLREAIHYFDLAIELDPDFALAHAGLSYAWLLIPEYDPQQDREESKHISREAAEKALQLDPDLPEGLVMSAWIELRNYQWDAAERLLDRALEIHPTNVDAMHWLSHVLSWQGRHDEALAVAQRAVDADPYSPLMTMNLSYIQMDAGDYEASIRTRDRTMRLKSDMYEQMRNVWLTFLRAGRYDDAAVAFEQWATGTGRNAEAARTLSGLLSEHDRTGRVINLPRDLLDELALGTENLGQVYAAVGDRENALRELEIALNERAGSRSVLSMKINPLYDFMRDEPRFVALMQEANLAP